MSDPTSLAILATFSAALLIFTVTAAVRKLLTKERTPENAARLPFPSSVEGEANPYQGTVCANSGEWAVRHEDEDVRKERVPTWFYHRLDLLGLGVIFMLFLGMVILGLSMQGLEEKLEINAIGLGFNIALQFLMAFGVLAVVVRRIGPVAWLGLRWREWPWVFFIAPAVVVGMWVLFGVMHFSGYMDWLKSLGVDAAQDSVKLLQESKDPLILGLMVFTAVVVAPVCEEVVFRGYFYAAGKKFVGPWCAGVCSALVFTAAHGNAMALLPIFVLGCLLAFVYQKTGSLWAPIAVHFCFNGATVLLQLAVRFLRLPVDLNS